MLRHLREPMGELCVGSHQLLDVGRVTGQVSVKRDERRRVGARQQLLVGWHLGLFVSLLVDRSCASLLI